METVDFLRDLGQALRSAGGVMSPEAFRANATQDDEQMRIAATQRAAQAAKADEWARLGYAQRHMDIKEIRAEYQNSSVSNPTRLDGTPNPDYVPFSVYAQASGVNVPTTGLGQPLALATPSVPEVSSVTDALKAAGTDTEAPAPAQPMAPAPAQPMAPAPVQPMAPAPVQPMAPAPVQPRGVNLQSAAAQHQGMIAQQEQQNYAQKQEDDKKRAAMGAIIAKTDPELAATFNAADSATQEAILKNRFSTTDATDKVQLANGNIGVLDKRSGKVVDTGVKGAPTATRIRIDNTNKTAGDLAKFADAITTDFYDAGRQIGYTPGAADIAVSAYVMNGKLPTGGRSDLVAKRQDYVQAGADRVAKQLHMTSDELVTQPQRVKAQALALDQVTKKEAALDATYRSFENNIASWDQAARGIPPELAGKLDAETKALFSKIDFSDVKSLNDAKLYIGGHFNDPRVQPYLLTTLAVQADLSRILSSQGQSAGRVTDAAMAHAQGMIPNGLNDNARKTTIAALKADGQGQLKGLRDKRKDILANLSKVGIDASDKVAAPTDISAAPVAGSDPAIEALLAKHGVK